MKPTGYYAPGSYFGDRDVFHPFLVVVVGLVLSIALQGVAPAILFALAEAATGDAYSSILTGGEPSGAAQAAVVKLVMICTQLVAFGLVAYWLTGLSGDYRRELRLPRTPLRFDLWGLAAITMLAALPVVQFFMIDEETLRNALPENLKSMADELAGLEDRASAMLENLLKSQLPLNLVFIAVVPALCEELFFRGFMLSNMRRFMNVHVAIWLTAIVFSSLHGQIFGFMPRLLLGALFGYLVFWSGSLWPAVVAHFTNNAVAGIVAYLAYNGYVDESLAEDDAAIPFYATAAAFAVAGAMLYLFRRQSPESETEVWPPETFPPNNDEASANDFPPGETEYPDAALSDTEGRPDGPRLNPNEDDQRQSPL